eukprot:SAG31_NODE_14270_length_817_cov_1.360724_2_plen_191_part_01
MEAEVSPAAIATVRRQTSPPIDASAPVKPPTCGTAAQCAEETLYFPQTVVNDTYWAGMMNHHTSWAHEGSAVVGIRPTFNRAFAVAADQSKLLMHDRCRTSLTFHSSATIAPELTRSSNISVQAPLWMHRSHVRPTTALDARPACIFHPDTSTTCMPLLTDPYNEYRWFVRDVYREIYAASSTGDVCSGSL